jgi:hypothetical protein
MTEKHFKEVFIMNNKIKDLVIGVCTLGEIVGISALIAMCLKRNNDCYKAECKLIEREADLCYSTIDILNKDAEIKELKKEIKQLKGEEVEEES